MTDTCVIGRTGVYNGIINLEIFSAIILLFLIVLQLRNHTNNRKDRAFNWCIWICLFLIVMDSSTYVICDYFPNLFNSTFYRIASAFAYSNEFIYTAFLFKYYSVAGNITEGKKYRINGIFRIWVYIITAVVMISFLTGDLVTETLDSAVEGPFYPIFRVAMISLWVLAAAVLLSFRRELGIKLFTAFSVSLIIQTIFAVLGIIMVDVDFSCAVFALTLLVLYVLAQNERVDYSRIAQTERALEELKQTNALLEKSYARLEEDTRNIEAIAGMYYTMYRANIETGEYYEISTVNRIHEIIVSDPDGTLQERFWSVMMAVARADYKDEALRFTNFTTLEERMKGKAFISLDIRNRASELWRFTFIRVGKKTEPLVNIIYTSQKVEEVQQ